MEDLASILLVFVVIVLLLGAAWLLVRLVRMLTSSPKLAFIAIALLVAALVQKSLRPTSSLERLSSSHRTDAGAPLRSVARFAGERIGGRL